MSGRPGIFRKQRVIVLYDDEEFETLRQWFARSTSRTIAAYVRTVSLQEPIGIISRNGSFDAFIDEVIVLRKTMLELRRDGKWSPANQERLIGLHEEIKLVIDKIADLCTPH